MATTTATKPAVRATALIPGKPCMAGVRWTLVLTNGVMAKNITVGEAASRTPEIVAEAKRLADEHNATWEVKGL